MIMGEALRDQRILLLISPFPRAWSQGARGGVADDVHFVEGFRAAGWAVHVLAPQSGAPDAYPGANVHVYPNFFSATERWPVAVRRLLWPVLFHATVLPRAVRLVRTLHPAFVLGASHYASVTTWWCRRRLSVPAGVKLAGVMDLVHTEWPRAKYIFKNCEQLVALQFPQDAWIVLDDGTAGGQVLRKRGIDPDRIHFLPNGVDVEWTDHLPDRRSSRNDLGIQDDARVVLFIARLVASKRTHHILLALPGVIAKAGRDVHLVVVGDGPERDRCERIAHEKGIADHVTFAGVVNHEDIPRYLAASDVFVSTSALTNAAIPTCEAMVCGVPPVVYDVGATSRVVHHEQSGLCVADGDIDGLEHAVSRVLMDDELRHRLADGAEHFARQQFTTWDQRISMELAIIESLAR